jgi:hypothetical protein
VWLAHVAQAKPFDDEFFADVRSLYSKLYHVTPTTEQLRALVEAN